MKKPIVFLALLTASCAAQTQSYSDWKIQAEVRTVFFTKEPAKTAEPEMIFSERKDAHKAREMLLGGKYVSIGRARWNDNYSGEFSPEFWRRFSKENGADLILFYAGIGQRLDYYQVPVPRYEFEALFFKRND